MITQPCVWCSDYFFEPSALGKYHWRQWVALPRSVVAIAHEYQAFAVFALEALGARAAWFLEHPFATSLGAGGWCRRCCAAW